VWWSGGWDGDFGWGGGGWLWMMVSGCLYVRTKRKEDRKPNTIGTLNEGLSSQKIENQTLLEH